MIRDEIQELVAQALAGAQGAGELPSFAVPEVQLEHPARVEHGDYSANLPLRIQGLARMKAIEVAEALRKHVPAHHAVAEVRVAPPGFLNFYLDPAWLASQTAVITAEGARYASSALGAGRRLQIEYVSANPTGPVHVGNGRGAAIGSTLARVLRTAGYDVEQEYYVNDAGTQVAIFARTLYARYQQLFGRDGRDPRERLPRRVHARHRRAAQGSSMATASCAPSAKRPSPELGELGIQLMVAQIRDDLELLRRALRPLVLRALAAGRRRAVSEIMRILERARPYRASARAPCGSPRHSSASRRTTSSSAPTACRPTSPRMSRTTTTSSSCAASTASSTSGAPTTRATSRG